jgi:hypothetical protein
MATREGRGSDIQLKRMGAHAVYALLRVVPFGISQETLPGGGNAQPSIFGGRSRSVTISPPGTAYVCS